jgi:hypothetical protein
MKMKSRQQYQHQQQHRIQQQRGLGRLRRNLGLLRILADSTQSPKLRRAIVQHSHDDLIGSVADCCHNVLNGRVKLSPQRRKQLAVHRRAIRLLASPKAGLKRKRALLLKANKQQTGGWIIPLLAAAVPEAIRLVVNLFKSKKQKQ